jgi:hypothetical protein
MSKVDDEVIGQLQEMLLRALLLNEPLPGSRRLVEFPDLSFILSQPTVIVLDENLAGSVSIEALPIPIRILSREDLLDEDAAQTQGYTAYLRFQPAKIEDNTVGLTLQAGIVPDDPSQHALGLSGIQVKFQKIGGQWRASDEPIFFAT